MGSDEIPGPGLRRGWTLHRGPQGRLYYMNHETRTCSLLPPVDCWDPNNPLPYGWEPAYLPDGTTYFLNHLNRTTAEEAPPARLPEPEDDGPPSPRTIALARGPDPQAGFGFVAGSERPVVVRCVTEGGPSDGLLLPGDRILEVDGKDVRNSPREQVIEIIRACQHSVTLKVCQPQTDNSTKRSAILTASKKARLKLQPPKVRFAEGVLINGSPLYCLFDGEDGSSAAGLPNVLKVFLESGHTKSFRYDASTRVQDVLDSLAGKLAVKCPHYFGLGVAHVLRPNRLAYLRPHHLIAKIASRPGAHNLRCVYRLMFPPKDGYELLNTDPAAFEYLYTQCCNDVVQERFTPGPRGELMLHLCSLQMYQHCQSVGCKLSAKVLDCEVGLDKFIPGSVLNAMKRKDLRRLLSHYLKQTGSLAPPGSKQLTPLQAKLHFLKIVSDLPGYGGQVFTAKIRDSTTGEGPILLSPKCGLCHVVNGKVICLARFDEVLHIRLSEEEILLRLKEKDMTLIFEEEQTAEDFSETVQQYCVLLANQAPPLEREAPPPLGAACLAPPSYHSVHTVSEAMWSYGRAGPAFHLLNLTAPLPAYLPHAVDHNMNETLLPPATPPPPPLPPPPPEEDEPPAPLPCATDTLQRGWRSANGDRPPVLNVEQENLREYFRTLACDGSDTDSSSVSTPNHSPHHSLSPSFGPDPRHLWGLYQPGEYIDLTENSSEPLSEVEQELEKTLSKLHDCTLVLEAPNSSGEAALPPPLCPDGDLEAFIETVFIPPPPSSPESCDIYIIPPPPPDIPPFPPNFLPPPELPPSPPPRQKRNKTAPSTPTTPKEESKKGAFAYWANMEQNQHQAAAPSTLPRKSGSPRPPPKPTDAANNRELIALALGEVTAIMSRLEIPVSVGGDQSAGDRLVQLAQQFATTLQAGDSGGESLAVCVVLLDQMAAAAQRAGPALVSRVREVCRLYHRVLAEPGPTALTLLLQQLSP